MSFTLEIPGQAQQQAAPQGGFTLELPGQPAQPAAPARQGNASAGGVLGGLAAGVMDPIHAGAQMLTQALPTGVVQAGNRFNNWLADNTGLVGRIPEGGVDQMVRDREAQYQADRAAAGRSGFDAARMVGNVAVTAPAALVPGANTIAGSALVGGGMGALQPVTEGDFWSEKGQQVALGGAAGAAGGAIAKGISRVIQPIGNPEIGAQVRRLMDQGVELTPGQIAGGTARRMEDMATSVPFMGSKIAASRQASIESFNQAALNRSLGQIGKKMPKGMVGHEAIEYAQKTISAEYDRILPKIEAVADKQFFDNIQDIASRANTDLLPEQAQQFGKILKDKVFRHFSTRPFRDVDDVIDVSRRLGYEASKAGRLGFVDDAVDAAADTGRSLIVRPDREIGRYAPSGGGGGQAARPARQTFLQGEKFKRADSELGRLATKWGKSLDPDQRDLGNFLRDMQAELRDAVARTNPKEAPELQKINSAFAAYLRSERAAAASRNEGVFTPDQLLSAVKAMDGGLRGRKAAQGKALMQDLANDARAVIPSTVPDSGTAGRAAQMALAASLGAGAPGPILGALGGAAMYSRPGQAAMRASLLNRPAIAGSLASLVERSAPLPLTAGLYQLTQQ